mgnify:CR=1 FL=1
MQRTEKYFENDAFRKTAAGVILAAEADAKTPSPVTNRTKEGVNPTSFTSRQGRSRSRLHPSPCSSGMQTMHRGSPFVRSTTPR